MKFETKSREFDAFQITYDHLINARNDIENSDWPEWLKERFNSGRPGEDFHPQGYVFFGSLPEGENYYFEVPCDGYYEVYAYDWIAYIDGKLIAINSVTFNNLFREVK